MAGNAVSVLFCGAGAWLSKIIVASARFLSWVAMFALLFKGEKYAGLWEGVKYRLLCQIIVTALLYYGLLPV
jgi:hypothetical protein